MRYYFIAGEPSGDLHASNSMREIKILDPDAEFAFTGGDLMSKVAGRGPDIHIRDMAFMGFVDVLLHIRQIRRNFKEVKKCIDRYKPQVLVLVDYPGFNLRMAKWAAERGIRVDYYISPTVWAWKENRVEKIRAYTHRLFVILPFEEGFYAKKGHKVYFVGHPLLDAIESQKGALPSREEFLAKNKLGNKPLVAVLPGSRRQELERMLGLMVKVAVNFPDHTFVIAASPHLPAELYAAAKQAGIALVYDQTYALLNHARAGVIKSGTSTLESALFDLPQVVCYKSGALSFAIARRIVNVKYISLVNLVLGREAVKELIQNDLTVENISTELKQLLYDDEVRARIREDYTQLRGKLGGGGASARVAAMIHEDALIT